MTGSRRFKGYASRQRAEAVQQVISQRAIGYIRYQRRISRTTVTAKQEKAIRLR